MSRSERGPILSVSSCKGLSGLHYCLCICMSPDLHAGSGFLCIAACGPSPNAPAHQFQAIVAAKAMIDELLMLGSCLCAQTIVDVNKGLTKFCEIYDGVRPSHANRQRTCVSCPL